MLNSALDQWNCELLLTDPLEVSVCYDTLSLSLCLCQYEYSFRTEHSAAARLPPSPTRTSLGSEA